jgi:UPF0042 nucleotide-binding protein
VTDALQLAVVTGLSGAGRNTAARCLEDLDWFVVDNLPPSLISAVVELASRAQGGVQRVAVVVDIRSRAFSSDLRAALAELTERGLRPRVLYLEASDEVLVQRYEANRRPHPLQSGDRLLAGINRERALLADLRGEADLVVDTSRLNVHELRRQIDDAFAEQAAPTLRVTVVSFGFKYGLPVDADLVADMRFLPNPHWVPELRPHTGREPGVRDYVLGQPGAGEFVDRWVDLFRIVAEGYLREGKRYVTVAVGCTGGKHRSVAVAEELARRLSGDGSDVRVVHRDLGRE